MLVPSTRLISRSVTMLDSSGIKSHDPTTRKTSDLMVMAAPDSCSNEDCSRILSI